jgi:hypothetical protein
LTVSARRATARLAAKIAFARPAADRPFTLSPD